MKRFVERLFGLYPGCPLIFVLGLLCVSNALG